MTDLDPKTMLVVIDMIDNQLKANIKQLKGEKRKSRQKTVLAAYAALDHLKDALRAVNEREHIQENDQ